MKVVYSTHCSGHVKRSGQGNLAVLSLQIEKLTQSFFGRMGCSIHQKSESALVCAQFTKDWGTFLPPNTDKIVDFRFLTDSKLPSYPNSVCYFSLSCPWRFLELCWYHLKWKANISVLHMSSNEDKERVCLVTLASCGKDCFADFHSS